MIGWANTKSLGLRNIASCSGTTTLYTFHYHRISRICEFDSLYHKSDNYHLIHTLNLFFIACNEDGAGHILFLTRSILQLGRNDGIG